MRPEKKAIINEIRSYLTEASFVILIDFTGMNVFQTNELRKRLSAVDSQVHVIKNRLFKLAVCDSKLEKMNRLINGPTAIVVGRGDLIDAAKLLKTFHREYGLLVTRAAGQEEGVLSQDDLDLLVKLPAKHVLQSMLVGTVAAPMAQLVGVIRQKGASLLYVLKAVQEKKGHSQLKTPP